MLNCLKLHFPSLTEGSHVSMVIKLKCDMQYLSGLNITEDARDISPYTQYRNKSYLKCFLVQRKLNISHELFCSKSVGMCSFSHRSISGVRH